MNSLKFITICTLVLFLLSTFSMVGLSTITDYKVDTGSQCSTATVTFHIQAQAGDQYNVTKFTVSKGACVAVSFYDSDSVDHAFTIDANSANNVTAFNIYITQGQTKVSNFQAPNKDVTIKFYCSVPGHEQNGMYGSLTVGNGSSSKSSPGFEMVPLLFGLFVTAGAVSIYKKRKN